jgi:CheY-like chemotaxis protein
MLVVDDHASTCALLAHELRRAYDVDTSTSAADALARIRDGAEYALILCDLIMPGMSGLDLVDAISREAPKLLPRIVLMTAGVASNADSRHLAATGVTLLFKPFDARHLMMIVEGMLTRADGA